MAYLLQDSEIPNRFYAGIRNHKILYASYGNDGILAGPIVFITEVALEATQLELEETQLELEDFDTNLIRFDLAACYP